MIAKHPLVCVNRKSVTPPARVPSDRTARRLAPAGTCNGGQSSEAQPPIHRESAAKSPRLGGRSASGWPPIHRDTPSGPLCPSGHSGLFSPERPLGLLGHLGPSRTAVGGVGVLVVPEVLAVLVIPSPCGVSEGAAAGRARGCRVPCTQPKVLGAAPPASQTSPPLFPLSCIPSTSSQRLSLPASAADPSRLSRRVSYGGV